MFKITAKNFFFYFSNKNFKKYMKIIKNFLTKQIYKFIRYFIDRKK